MADKEGNGEKSGSEIGLRPVLEVTENSENEFAELKGIDGIFKFDNTRVYIPKKDAFLTYNVKDNVSINDINDIYEQYYWLEEEFLGYHYPADLITACYTVDDKRADVTLAEAVKRDDMPFVLINLSEGGTENGQIEWLAGGSVRCWYTKELIEARRNCSIVGDYDTTIYHLAGFNINETVYASYADEQTMEKKRKLYKGEISLREAGEWCEDYIRRIPYINDEHLTFKAERFDVRENEENCTITVGLLAYIDGVPFAAPNDFMMIQPEKADCAILPEWDRKYIPREGEKITRIVPLSGVFDIIKKKLSNSIVYDVDEIMLCYGIYNQVERYEAFEDIDEPFVPLWTVRMHTINREIYVTVNASTGECKIYDEQR